MTALPRWLAFWLAFVLACSPAAAAELRGKVHAVLVFDTNGPDLAKALEKDADMVRAFLNGGIGADRLTVHELKGDRVSLAEFRTLIAGLPLDADDALVCFVGSHGVTDKESREHVFAFHPPAGREFVKRSDLRRLLLDRKARLTVLLSDSCSNVEPIFAREPRINVFSPRRIKQPQGARMLLGTFAAPRRSEIRPCFQKLFLSTSGVVDINGSFDSTYAWFHEDIGGVFTTALHETFHKTQDEEPASWAAFYATLKGETQETYLKFRDESLRKYRPLRERMNRKEREDFDLLDGQKEQTTQVFFLAGTRLKLITEEIDGVMVVRDLPLDSPARAAGLRVGDVIVTINEKRILSAKAERAVVEAAFEGRDAELTYEVQRKGTPMTFSIRVPPR